MTPCWPHSLALTAGPLPHGLLGAEADIAAQPGYVRGELIYPLDRRPVPECHASTIAETPDGVVAAWFGGKHEKAKDVGIWFARHRDGALVIPLQKATELLLELVVPGHHQRIGHTDRP